MGATAVAGMAQQSTPASPASTSSATSTNPATTPGKLSLDYPVPAWPADGVIPPDLKDHYVFVDVNKNQYVVAYPENLGKPDFAKSGPGQREVSRYPLQRAVDPAVLLNITKTPDGKYKYVYTVADGTNAKGSIQQWVLSLPPGAVTSGTEKHPAGWFGVLQKGRKLDVVDPHWIETGGAAVFVDQKPDEQINPGAKKAGFELDSTFKPGFTVGYFQQAESTDGFFQQSGNIPTDVVHNATPPPPPKGAAPPAGGRGGGAPAGATKAWTPVENDVAKVERVEYNSKPVITLAPKFDQTATDAQIATDFKEGLTVMSTTGVVSADSPFVKGTLSDLDTYIKGGASGPLKLSSVPKGDAETEVFNAMKVSLHLN
jgi:hypothetical protein